MIEKFTKAFGVFHWDTFEDDPELATMLVGETDTFTAARILVKEKYGSRIRPDGADIVEIVDRNGDVIEKFRVG